LRNFEICVPSADGESVASRVSVMVPMTWDETINEWLLTPGAMDEIECVKARHMGLLPANEIRALRERLGLTQGEIAELLKIGAKTWTRWESGRQRPSQSLNLLLRALQTGVITPYMLQQLGAPQIDWTQATEAAAAAAAAATETGLTTIELPPAVCTPGTYEGMPLAA
jgi:DNA-binding transcriptional regulator YiaG